MPNRRIERSLPLVSLLITHEMVRIAQVQLREDLCALQDLEGWRHKGQRIPILDRYVVQPPIIYAGTQRAVGGTMISAARDSVRYFSKASRSGTEREYSLPRGGMVPGRRSILQSYGRWGGKDVARERLKTARRSRYSSGTPDKSPGSSWNTETEETTGTADTKQLIWQASFQERNYALSQLISGLCWVSHGWPKTIGVKGDWKI